MPSPGRNTSFASLFFLVDHDNPPEMDCGPERNPKWAWIQSAGHRFGPTKVSLLLVSKNPCWDVDNVDPYPTLNKIDIENPPFTDTFREKHEFPTSIFGFCWDPCKGLVSNL